MVGLRISADEDDIGGMDRRSVIEICRQLADEGLVDYINTTMGTMAALGGSIHVVPPMEIAPAYVAPRAAAIRPRSRCRSSSPAASTSRRSPRGCWPPGRQTCAA
jgi:2,4-dienoyl-CoA reductase-like NADH-dependent reductase (Old Yellow Enzyme family)